MIPDHIKKFVDQNIETIDQLEILRVLSEHRTQEWSVLHLSREVQAQPGVITNHLAALKSRGLLTSIARGQETLWMYTAQTPELDKSVQDLLQCYQERPVTMIRMVYAKAADALKTFADAFRIRKED